MAIISALEQEERDLMSVMPRPDRDSALILLSIFVLGVVAAEVFIVQPGFVQGLVAFRGFNDVWAGYTASAEMFGLAASAILMGFISHRVDWHRIIAWSIAVMFVTNTLCLLVDSTAVFITLRFLAGLGAGGLVTLSFAAVALTANPERNYGLLMMWVLIYGAIGLWAMPSLFSFGGLAPVLLFFAIFPLTIIPLLKFIPSGVVAPVKAEADTADISSPLKWGALAAILLYFTAQGVIWAYLFLIGLAGGLGDKDVANALTMSQLGGVTGALLAAVIGRHFRATYPLVLGIAGGAACLFVLIGPFDFVVFALTVSVYNFAWNLTHPFLFGAVASFDLHGKLVVYAVAMQMIGLAFGPFVAATIVSVGTFNTVLLVGVGLFLACLLLFLPPVLAHGRVRAR